MIPQVTIHLIWAKGGNAILDKMDEDDFRFNQGSDSFHPTSLGGGRRKTLRFVALQEKALLGVRTACPAPPNGRHLQFVRRSSSLADDHPVNQKEQHRAEDRENPAGNIIGPPDHSSDPGANKRASDAEQNGDDETTGIFSRHKKFGNRANDKTNDKRPE
jgi:hypothetical protein